MARDNENIFVAADGRVYVAAHGSPAPTDATTVPTAHAAGDLGWFHEDGLTEDYSEDRTEFGGWGTRSSLRVVSTKVDRPFKLIALENTPLVYSLHYKVALPTPDGDGAFDFAVNDSGGQDLRSWIIDTMDGLKIVRYYVHSGEITGRATVTSNQSTRKSFEWTITPYPDSNADTCHIFVEMPHLGS